MRTLILALAFTLISTQARPVEIHLNSREVGCLAKVIYHEARGEPELGQHAVAHVVMNRTKSGKYPATVCKVVYQQNQFTDIQKTKVKFSSSEWKSAMRIAIVTYGGLDSDPTSGATYYFAHKKCDPRWAKSKKFLVRIYNHTFLGERNERAIQSQPEQYFRNQSRAAGTLPVHKA